MLLDQRERPIGVWKIALNARPRTAFNIDCFCRTGYRSPPREPSPQGQSAAERAGHRFPPVAGPFRLRSVQFLAGCRPMTFQITNCVCDLLPHSKLLHIAFGQERVRTRRSTQLRIFSEQADHFIR